MSKTNLKYRLSKYASIFKKNNIFCYWHSLKMIPIYLTKEQQDYVSEYLENNIDTPENKEIIDCFRKNNFLISKKEEDDILYEKVKKEILLPELTIGYFILTEACNLACTYCFLGNGKKNIEHNLKAMDKNVAKMSFELFIKQSVLSCSDNAVRRELIFYGGEPLINFNILKYIVNLYKQYRSDGQCPFEISFSVVTNGTLITEEIAKFFRENEINISLSLDGPSQKSNENRILKESKKCAFSEIISAINILRNANCSFGLSYTLSEQSLEVSIEDLIRFLLANEIHAISFNTLICSDNLKSKKYYEMVASYIINFWETARNSHIFEDRMSRKIKAFATKKFQYSDCAATSGCQLCFFPDGSIRICHGCKKGDVTTEWNVFGEDDIKYMESKEIFDWLMYSPVFYEQCKNCPSISICGGGCILNKKLNFEDKNIDLGFCIQTKRIHEFLIWDLYKKLCKGE